MRSLLRFTLRPACAKLKLKLRFGESRQAQGEGNFLMVSLSNHETSPSP
jgi:hypothetical protein